MMDEADLLLSAGSITRTLKNLGFCSQDPPFLCDGSTACSCHQKALGSCWAAQ